MIILYNKLEAFQTNVGLLLSDDLTVIVNQNQTRLLLSLENMTVEQIGKLT